GVIPWDSFGSPLFRPMRTLRTLDSSLMMAEILYLALSPILGRAEARKLVSDAGQVVLEQRRYLVNVVRERTAPLDWEALKDEAAYFGSAQAFVDRVLHEVGRG
ncbi:MAG TPA: hypothetical protein VMT34_01095, partial [Aggregatilineales bacterium]|nr:hypothetical protein [Aggregatilineales bacterium]